MRLRKLMGIGLFVVLPACTTPRSVSDNEPFYSGHSSKSREATSACVAARWSRTKGFHTRLEDHGAETSVILSGSSVTGIDMIATVHENGDVEMHKRPAAWSHLDERLRDDIVGCI